MAIEAECRHCAQGAAPAMHEPQSRCAASSRELEEIGDDERWLWRLVTEAERIAAAAPQQPDPQRLALAQQQYEAVLAAEERVVNRIRVTESALARPSSWLRPAHRAALVRLLREDRCAAVATAVQRGRAERTLHRLRALEKAYEAYLAMHHDVLDAGRNARAELEQIVDDLIDGYAKLEHPPAWFRFGLGYPPAPGAQPQWLAMARAVVAQRRRVLFERPEW